MNLASAMRVGFKFQVLERSCLEEISSDFMRRK